MASLLSSPILRFEAMSRTPRTNLNRSTKSRTYTTAACAMRSGSSFNGRFLDEHLIVLRKRIHEMKMIERNYVPPVEWMDWEKEMYTSYASIVCDTMGHLQAFLLDRRPSMVLGMMALVSLSVPFSTGVVLFNLFELTKGLMLPGQ